MPFDVEMPDGTLVQDVPDGTTKAQIQAKYAAHIGQQQPSMAADVAKSLPTGLVHGLTGLAGLPSDALNAVGNLTRKLTGSEQIPNSDPRALQFMGIPTSGQFEQAVKAVTGGLYEPQTTPGRYAETVASFALNAVIPGTAAQRLARVLVPGVASEGAGQAAEKYLPQAAPYARALGALAGGIGEGLFEGSGSKVSIPTEDELKNTANSLYTNAKNAGVNISSDAYDNLVGNINSAVTEAGTHPHLHPKVAAALSALDDAKGTDIPLGDMERLRRIANGAAKSIEPDERRVAGVILDKIDDFMDNLKSDQVSSGDSSVAGTLSEARATWAKLRKSQTVSDAIERAKNTAEAQRGNLAAGLRSQFKMLVNNQKLMRGFSPDEQQAIRDVARVGTITGPMAALGALRPRGWIGLSEMAGAVAHPEAGAPLLATALAGEASQRGLNAITSNQAARVGAMIRAGQTLPPTVNPNSALLAALLSQAAAKPATQSAP